jgi:hypothetical protein
MNQIPDTYDKRVYDKARAFCRVERIDEDNFRYCIGKRLRETEQRKLHLRFMQWKKILRKLSPLHRGVQNRQQYGTARR